MIHREHCSNSSFPDCREEFAVSVFDVSPPEVVVGAMIAVVVVVDTETNDDDVPWYFPKPMVR